MSALAPPPDARSAYYRWLFFAAGPLETAAANHSLGFEVPADKEKMAGYGSFDAVVDTLAQAVADEGYVAGDRFSAADIYVGFHIGWGMQFDTVEKSPGFEAYWARVSDRDAYRRAN